MDFSLERSIPILERTPSVLRMLLLDLPEDWVMSNEGEATWSPYDVVGHLIHGERADWMDRIRLVLQEGGDKQFVPFDRFAQFEESKGKSLSQLLDEFEELRKKNLKLLAELRISDADLQKTAIHPAFGTVTLRQLLSTWVAHDLSHLVQISRTMAKQYREEIGPWRQYISIMK